MYEDIESELAQVRSMQNRGVLITDGNERSALAATRALGRRGIPVYVGSDSGPSLAGRSKYCADRFQYPSPWTNPGQYVDCILEAARRWNVAVLLPMTDIAVELIGERQAELGENVRVPIPSLDQYRHLSNKYDLARWAKANGVPVPESVFVPEGDVEKVLNLITRWPVIVKPGTSLLNESGLWKRTAVHVARNADDLIHLYADHWYLKRPSLIQQRIVGEGQGVFGLFDNGKPIVLFAHRRIREKPPGGGVSVLRESIPLVQPMTEYALRIVQSVGWHGVAMVEFKVDRESQVPFLIEVNGRFWGSLQLAVDAGVDFPLLTYELATAGLLESRQEGYEVGIKSRWFLGDLDQLLLRLRKSDEQLGLPSGSPTKVQALLSFMNVSDRRSKSEVFRWSDPQPGIYEGLCYLRQVGRAIWGVIYARIPDAEGFMLRGRWRFITWLGFQEFWLRRRLPEQISSIVVLCKGNVCRSPFAAEFLRQLIQQRGLAIHVSSAGIEAIPNQGAYPLAKDMSRQYGVWLDAHRTTLLSNELVSKADLILVMEIGQLRRMRTNYAGAKDKFFLLGQFSKTHDCEIQDPYGEGRGTFVTCFDHIRESCDRLVAMLVQKTAICKNGRLNEGLATRYGSSVQGGAEAADANPRKS